jgi:magnesium transporter
VISHRVNDILRVLTAISVIVLPLTLIASVFGMNVGLPGGGDPTAGASASFWVIIGVIVAVLLGIFAYFRRRGWL